MRDNTKRSARRSAGSRRKHGRVPMAKLVPPCAKDGTPLEPWLELRSERVLASGERYVIFDADWGDGWICPRIYYSPERKRLVFPRGWRFPGPAHKLLQRLAHRYWAKLIRTDEERLEGLSCTEAGMLCRTWLGSMDSRGRPRMKIGGKNALLRGTLLPGPNTCGNPLCVASLHNGGRLSLEQEGIWRQRGAFGGVSPTLALDTLYVQAGNYRASREEILHCWRVRARHLRGKRVLKEPRTIEGQRYMEEHILHVPPAEGEAEIFANSASNAPYSDK